MFGKIGCSFELNEILFDNENTKFVLWELVVEFGDSYLLLVPLHNSEAFLVISKMAMLIVTLVA